MLVAGLLLSIPILMFGSVYISRLLDVFPYLLWVGGAILGGVSGALIIDDSIFGVIAFTHIERGICRSDEPGDWCQRT